MDWMLFWTAFGAIGGTFGALETAIAVIVELWQTIYSHGVEPFTGVCRITTVTLLNYLSLMILNWKVF